MDENGCQVLIEDGRLQIRDQHRRLLCRVPRGNNRLYILTLNITKPVCLSARGNDTACRWHARYGYLNFDALQKLSNQIMVHGLTVIDHVDQICNSYLAGKQRRASFSQVAKYRARSRLELVRGDLCGPISPETPGERRYFLLLVDDFSRYMWILLLSTKDEAPTAIKRFQVAAEVEGKAKLQVLRTDRGGEFNSSAFKEYCAELG